MRGPAAAVCLLATLVTACGENPTGPEPEPFPDVSGDYVGGYVGTPAASNAWLVDHEGRPMRAQDARLLCGEWAFDVTFYVAGQDRTENPDPYVRTFTGDVSGRVWRDGRVEVTTQQMCDRQSLWVRYAEDAPGMLFRGSPTLFVAVDGECPTSRSVSGNLQLGPL